MSKPQRSGEIFFPQTDGESVRFSLHVDAAGVIHILVIYSYVDSEEEAMFGWHFSASQLVGFIQFLMQFTFHLQGGDRKETHDGSGNESKTTDESS